MVWPRARLDVEGTFFGVGNQRWLSKKKAENAEDLRSAKVDVSRVWMGFRESRTLAAQDRQT